MSDVPVTGAPFTACRSHPVTLGIGQYVPHQEASIDSDKSNELSGFPIIVSTDNFMA
jgi:hypothetical protein